MAKEKEPKDFFNPLEDGVTYGKFLKHIPSGTTVEDYLKGNLEQHEIDWIVTELEHYNNNKNQ